MADDTTPETATVEEPTENTEPESPVEGEEALGDPGKKALELMKQERREARDEAKKLREELAQLRAERELAGKPPEVQEIEKARAEARAEAFSAANERIARSELKAAATGKLADPTDAALFIDPKQFDVSDDGSVDADALSQAIDDLIASKPHLAAKPARKFTGDADQGAKAKPVAPVKHDPNELIRAAFQKN